MKTNKPRMRMAGLALMLAAGTVWANNLAITNVTVTPKDQTTAYVKFDIAWENSWRYTNINHDAAWVFFKVQQEGQTDWKHVILEANQVTNPAGYSVGSGTALDFIVPADKVGMLVRRQAEGAGPLAATNVQAVWNFASNSLSRNSRVIMQAFVVEMVFVAPGSFKVGSGGSEANRFYAGGATNDPFTITNEGAITVADSAGNLYYRNDGGGSPGDRGSPIPAEFPKGYAGFYCMKYEITEGQWVDFFNTLLDTQKSALDITGSPGKSTDGVSGRNTVSWLGGAGLATSAAKDRACNFLAWADIMAFTAWAGLRPMTELEFEKACRGPLAPVINECAWGDSTAITISGLQGIDGSGTEYYTTGNAYFSGNGGRGWPSDGPERVGIFAKPGSSRKEAGASYWGIMELSGNLLERAVTVGNATGRSFTGKHGNGTLTADGKADVAALSWPAVNGTGAGSRGGHHSSALGQIQISDRSAAAATDANRGDVYGHSVYGGRAVRTAPVEVTP